MQGLNEHDHWPQRIAAVGLILFGLVALVLAGMLISQGRSAQGLLAIPASVVTALALLLMRRPPWTSRKTEGE